MNDLFTVALQMLTCKYNARATAKTNIFTIAKYVGMPRLCLLQSIAPLPLMSHACKSVRLSHQQHNIQVSLHTRCPPDTLPLSNKHGLILDL